MWKFIHAADVHLDSPQRGLERYEGAPVAECRGATRRALENLVELALRESVDFVVLVGDLYDGDWPDYSTGLFFSRQMARLREVGIPVILVRGNHDAANRMTKDLKLAENVRLLSDRSAETVVLEDQGVAVHGRSFPTRVVVDNLSLSYPPRLGGYFNIGLLHTCVDGREGHEPYAPCSLTDLRQREYDYWALGHIHAREILHRDEPWIVFPGNIQGRHARETGPKGCFLVTADDSQRVVSAEPRWLDVVRWETCRVDARGARDGDELLLRFQERLTALLRESGDRLVALRVEIEGPTPAHPSITSRPTHWLNEIRQVGIDVGNGRVWVEKVLLRTSLPGTPIADEMEAAPLAELAAYLGELRDTTRLTALADSVFDDLVRKLPPDLVSGLTTPERLEGLLDDVALLLRERLVRP